jgi:hypothetical protein
MFGQAVNARAGASPERAGPTEGKAAVAPPTMNTDGFAAYYNAGPVQVS